MNQPQKALDYLNSSSGRSLQQYLLTFGMSGVIDQSYGFIFSELNRQDSARFYMMKALPYFENNINESSKMQFYLQLARFYDKAGETKSAIDYYEKAKEAGERNGVLEIAITASKHLDSMYNRIGNFKMASTYNSRGLVPEVLVDGDKFAIVAERIAPETILAAEHVPDWLK